jgi:hypothetical protein
MNDDGAVVRHAAASNFGGQCLESRGRRDAEPAADRQSLSFMFSLSTMRRQTSGSKGTYSSITVNKPRCSITNLIAYTSKSPLPLASDFLRIRDEMPGFRQQGLAFFDNREHASMLHN